jgi:chromatin structure-remodeling complex subunit RSC1/2
MPVTNAQKAAIEQVIEAIKSVTSPRKKRVLAELFLDLVDKEAWANYYQVTLLIFVPLSAILSPVP